MKNRLLIWIIAIAIALLISGCANQQKGDIAEKGFLAGKISIGPLCPVERIPPESHCQPTQETYKAWPLSVWTADKKTRVASIAVAADGTFSTQLLPGNYIVDLDKQQPIGLGRQNLPATATITAGKITRLDIDIDTGIR